MKEPSGNGYVPIIAQAIEEMKAEWGDTFSLEQINLAELERRTGISRGKLRRLKKNGFQDSRRNGDSGKHKITKLTGYSGIIDTLLKQGVSNSTVILNRLQESGFEGIVLLPLPFDPYISATRFFCGAFGFFNTFGWTGNNSSDTAVSKNGDFISTPVMLSIVVGII